MWFSIHSSHSFSLIKMNTIYLCLSLPPSPLFLQPICPSASDKKLLLFPCKTIFFNTFSHYLHLFSFFHCFFFSLYVSQSNPHPHPHPSPTIFPAPSLPPCATSELLTELFSPILERRHTLYFSPWLKPIAINLLMTDK